VTLLPHFHYRAPALDLKLSDPREQMRWALKYIRSRYGLTPFPWSSWAAGHYERGGTMGRRLNTQAPANPYRQPDTQTEELFAGAGMGYVGPGPRRHDTEDGPGITAGDLDRIARDHHRDGYAKAERKYEAQLDELRARLADAYDEGYFAGRIERAQGLARDVFTRLFDPQSKVITARGIVTDAITAGPKAKATERVHVALDGIEASLVEVREFAAALFTPHDPAGAEALAAAHVAATDPHSTTSLR
jgi:hypothetical protein